MKKAFLLIQLICIFWPVSSQPLHFRHLGTENGLSQITVNVIYQDRAGYLWFGTQDGLNIYDGYSFRYFKTNPEDPNSLSHSWIWDVYEDSENELWIATWKGLNKLSPDRNTNTRYLPDPENPESIRGERPVSLSEDSDGILWVGSWGGGLSNYDRQTNGFHHYSSSLDRSKDLPGDFIRKIFIDKDDQLWIGTWNGLWKGSKTNKDWTFKYMDLGLREGARVTSIIQDHDNRIWIGTLGNGLFGIDPYTDSLVIALLPDILSEKLLSRQITSLAEDNIARIWVGTVSDGFGIYDPISEEWQHISADPLIETSISSDKIVSMYKDRSGLMWLGTTGIDFCNPESNNFNDFFPYSLLGDKNSPVNNVSVIHVDKQQRIWMGTSDHGLFCYIRPETMSDHTWITDNIKLLNNTNISSIVTDEDDYLWVGTRGNGIVKLAQETPTFLNIVDTGMDENRKGINYINGMVLLPPSTLWLATYDQGLISYNIQTKTFRKFYNNPDDPGSFPANYLLRIYKDVSEKLWICTWGAGLIYFDPVDTGWETFTFIPEDTSSLSDNIIHTIMETDVDKGREIWAGTGNGLSRIRIQDNGTWNATNLFESDGLPGNVINAILQNNADELWISTNSGLSKLNIDSMIFVNYDVHDGLQGNEFNAGASALLPDGRMIFGGVKGFNVFNPDKIIESDYNPEIVISKVKVFEEEYPLNPCDNHLELNYMENFISFEFAALDYNSPEKNKYRYMMKGIDKDWVYSSTRHFANYTDIKPGSYAFHVQGTNSVGQWSRKTAQYTIRISPPYWQRWWFRIGMGILLVLLILLPVNYRIRRLKEIERLRVRIASDLHDDIGSSLTHINIHSQRIKEEKDYSGVSSSLDKIGDLSREIISTMSDIVWSIDARNDSIADMLDRMKDYVFNACTDLDLKVTFHEENMLRNKKMNVLFRQNLFSIFKEAVNNIIKHAEASEVHVLLRNSPKEFLMQIKDDGKGFEEKSGSGNGLRNMRLRARRLGGQISINSEKGTTIEVRTRSLH